MMTSPDTPASGLTNYKRLLGYAQRYWPVFVVAVIAMAIFAATDATFALLMRDLIDEDIVKNNPDRISHAPILLVLLFFVRGLTSFISGGCMAWIGRMLVFNLRDQMFSHMMRMPSRSIDQQSSGQLVSTFTYNTEQIAQAVTTAVTVLIRDSLTIIFLLATLFYLQGLITVMFLTVGPVVAFLLYKLSMRFRRISRRIQGSMGDMTSNLQQTVENDKLIKLHNGGEYQKNQFYQLNKKNKQQQLKMLLTSIASAPFIQFLVGVIVAVIIYFLIERRISAGAFVAYVTALLAIMPPLKRLTTVNSAIQKGIAASETIFAHLDSVTENDKGTKTLSQIKGNIEFKNVSFSYDGETPVLSDINLTVKAGEQVAIVGKSGGGKTTLVNLLPRFYETTGGQILIDGHDITEISLTSLRDQFALVSQSVSLFDDTIAHNIAYGSLDSMAFDKVKAAADAAHATEFIETLENGFDTRVGGEGGTQLSGGQRQRLAIARALLKDAPILILDEATSALDSESEKFVQEGIERLSQNRTTFIIAHRLSTIESADKIVVIENGRVVEMGSHEDLLAKQGSYAKYYRNQFSEADA